MAIDWPSLPMRAQGSGIFGQLVSHCGFHIFFPSLCFPPCFPVLLAVFPTFSSSFSSTLSPAVSPILSPPCLPLGLLPCLLHVPPLSPTVSPSVSHFVLDSCFPLCLPLCLPQLSLCPPPCPLLHPQLAPAQCLPLCFPLCFPLCLLLDHQFVSPSVPNFVLYVSHSVFRACRPPCPPLCLPLCLPLCPPLCPPLSPIAFSAVFRCVFHLLDTHFVFHCVCPTVFPIALCLPPCPPQCFPLCLAPCSNLFSNLRAPGMVPRLRFPVPCMGQGLRNLGTSSPRCPRQTVTQLFSTIPSCFPELVLHLSPNCVPPPPNFSQMWSSNSFPTAIRLCPNSLQLWFSNCFPIAHLSFEFETVSGVGLQNWANCFHDVWAKCIPLPWHGRADLQCVETMERMLTTCIIVPGHRQEPTNTFFFVYHVSSHLCFCFSDLITFICFHFCFRFAIFPNLPLLIFQSCPLPWKPSKHWEKRNGKKNTETTSLFKFGGVKPELANFAWTKPEKLRKMNAVKNKKRTSLIFLEVWTLNWGTSKNLGK